MLCTREHQVPSGAGMTAGKSPCCDSWMVAASRQRPSLCIHRTSGRACPETAHAHRLCHSTRHKEDPDVHSVNHTGGATPSPRGDPGDPRKASPARAGDGRRVCSVASAEVWRETVRTVAQSEPGGEQAVRRARTVGPRRGRVSQCRERRGQGRFWIRGER